MHHNLTFLDLELGGATSEFIPISLSKENNFLFLVCLHVNFSYDNKLQSEALAFERNKEDDIIPANVG